MDKIKSGIVILSIVAVFTAGYFTGKQPTKETITQTKEVAVEKETDKDHKQTEITQTKDKQGDVKTVTIITEDTTKTDDIAKTDTSTVTAIDNTPKNVYRLAGMAGVDYHNPTTPVYGIEISKKVLGEISIGLYGQTNGTVGITIGVEF